MLEGGPESLEVVVLTGNAARRLSMASDQSLWIAF